MSMLYINHGRPRNHLPCQACFCNTSINQNSAISRSTRHATLPLPLPSSGFSLGRLLPSKNRSMTFNNFRAEPWVLCRCKILQSRRHASEPTTPHPKPSSADVHCCDICRVLGHFRLSEVPPRRLSLGTIAFWILSASML